VKFLSSRPCPAGHVGWRYTRSGACCLCNDIRRAARLGLPFKEKPQKTKAQRQQSNHERNIEAGRRRFAQASFTHALRDYNQSPQARGHNDYLNSLLKVTHEEK
jgi:hypothetical protein